MGKFRALSVVALALALVPCAASAAPAASQITAPADHSFLVADPELPQSLQIAGTTSGGDGDVDIRCYHGAESTLIVGPVPVDKGAFAEEIPLDMPLVYKVGYPYPSCTLRAVPTGTEPAAAPGSPSEWAGPGVGWGTHQLFRIGNGFDPNPPETLWDYDFSLAQPRAYNDFDSATSCGLCDTYLFVPGTKAISNSIWYVNAGLFVHPYDVDDRTGLNIDGLPAYGTASAHFNATRLDATPGLPALSVGTSVDPVSGDLTVDEHAEFKHCAPSPSVLPATSSSCTSFTDSGVVLNRRIRVTDEGMLVTFTDHWKSVDGKAHELDALYEDSEHSENGMSLGHESRANFTWTQDGFESYGPDEQIPAPDTAPATVLIKTDRTTPDAGDNMNPFGAVVYGTRPSELTVVSLGRVADGNGRWHPRYLRTIPADGENLITIAYTHDFTLDGVKARAKRAADLLAPPAADSPSGDAPSGDAPALAPAGSAPETAQQSTAAEVPGKPVACVVPKLRGKTLAIAGRLLKEAHCRLGKVTRRTAKSVKPGRVVKTRFKAGSRHRASTRVPVTIAKKA